MSTLSKEQRDFLRHHKIPASVVFDATGLTPKEWKFQMEQLGLRFAFGVGPCKRGNHTLRTRSGNCMQCEPANIAFINRHYDDGFVYIAYSLEKVLLKVGVAKSVKRRTKSLNSLGYAGANDWKVLQSVKAKGAGQIEFAIHADLASHNVSATYLRDGNPVVCREVFRCNTGTVSWAFEKYTGKRCEISHEISEKFKRFRTEENDINTEVDDVDEMDEEWDADSDFELDDADDNYSIFAVSAPTTRTGVHIGFTALEQSSLLRKYQKLYPEDWVTLWCFIACPKHRKNEEIFHTITNHIRSLPDGFLEIKPLSRSISLCTQIVDKIKIQVRKDRAKSNDLPVLAVHDIPSENDADDDIQNVAEDFSEKDNGGESFGCSSVTGNDFELNDAEYYYSIFAVSAPTTRTGVKIGFTSLDKSDLLQKYKNLYPEDWVTVWCFIACPKHRKNRDLLFANTKHLRSMPDGFLEIDPLSSSISLCAQIVEKIKMQVRKDRENSKER